MSWAADCHYILLYYIAISDINFVAKCMQAGEAKQRPVLVKCNTLMPRHRCGTELHRNEKKASKDKEIADLGTRQFSAVDSPLGMQKALCCLPTSTLNS